MFLVFLIAAVYASASKSSSRKESEERNLVLPHAGKPDPSSAELDRHNDSKSGDATTPLNQQPPDFSEILNQKRTYMDAKRKRPYKELGGDLYSSDLDGALSNVVRRLEV